MARHGGRQRARGRQIDGILLLDKPRGISSNAALQRVKHLFHAAKAGHTGNLDPLATGLLVICFGEATKVSAFLLDADKRYRGICKLGARTTTADAEGEVIERRPLPSLNDAQIESVLARFRGDIEQIPPMHSAIKQQGKPLYELARQGVEVERKPRTVTIHDLQAVRLAGDELEIDVHCSKGTYIRTLAEDIGEALGCGAHLGALRRTSVGPFQLAAATLPEQLEALAEQGVEALDALLQPIDAAFADWPRVQLTENGCFYLGRGQPVQVAQAPVSGLVRLFGPGERLIGVGEVIEDGRIAPKRLFNR